MWSIGNPARSLKYGCCSRRFHAASVIRAISECSSSGLTTGFSDTVITCPCAPDRPNRHGRRQDLSRHVRMGRVGPGGLLVDIPNRIHASDHAAEGGAALSVGHPLTCVI